MKILKYSICNTIFISFISTIYSFIFIFTSDHIEFLRIFSKTTLASDFWNGWSNFIRAGNLKYIGYLIIVLTVLIVLSVIFNPKKKYDEYQLSVLSKIFIIAGIIVILIVPVMMLLLLSDPSYVIEIILLFAVIEWLSILITNLIFVINYR